MWKFRRGPAPTGNSNRPQAIEHARTTPGPMAKLACDYVALDAAVWALSRRRPHAAEGDAR